MSLPSRETSRQAINLIETPALKTVSAELASGASGGRSSVMTLRQIVQQLDGNFQALAPEPRDGSGCPGELAEIAAALRQFDAIAESAGLMLLGRVVGRQLALVESLRATKGSWNLLVKLALEELTSVLDMVLDVVELVGSDSGCRQEERFSFRILASVAPRILAEVDGLSFREIRFHQASSRGVSARAC